MNIYDAPSIKRTVQITRYLSDIGYTIRAGRCQARWRGGDGWNVAIDDAKGIWYDHKAGEGGSVIDLCMKVEGVTPLVAMRRLGDKYNVPPFKVTRAPRKRTRAEMLVADGFARTASYEYTDELGAALYYVDRYEKTDKDGSKRKEFIQRSLVGEGLDGVTRVLYNLPAVLKAQTVYVVEGEKDVETMRRLGLVATTNSGGGKYWKTDFNGAFAGKDVVVIPDNDAVGMEHGRLIYSQLAAVARSCRLCAVSRLPKGDVTDYIEKEGGTLAGLLEMVAAAKQQSAERPDVAAAKLANKTPFRNYAQTTDSDGKRVFLPVLVDDMIADMKTRFLEFPRRLGNTLFDYTRDHRKIVELQTRDSLKAWVNGTSRHQSEFRTGGPYCSWAELFERLLQTVTRYEGISAAPWYPARANVFPTYPMLPPADPLHTRFWELVDRFCPATKADKILMAAFFCAPMFYDPAAARPAWVIDTVDAQSSGKSTVVKMACLLYNEIPLGMDLNTLDRDLVSIKKRLLSSAGRRSRIALFDNVEQTLKSSALADFVTSASITGMAPYGRGEESRPNDITWTATVNGAEVDTDMATRSYLIRVRKPANPDPMWERRTQNLIEEHRLQIYADILDMFASAPFRVRRESRFGVFDSTVLSAVCRSDEEFALADSAIQGGAAGANTDAELGAEFMELVTAKIAAADNFTTARIDGLPVAIRCTDIDRILRSSSGALRTWTSKRIRRLVKAGMIPQVDRDVERIGNNSNRSMLFYLNGDEGRFATVRYQLLTIGSGGLPTLSEKELITSVDRSIRV